MEKAPVKKHRATGEFDTSGGAKREAENLEWKEEKDG